MSIPFSVTADAAAATLEQALLDLARGGPRPPDEVLRAALEAGARALRAGSRAEERLAEMERQTAEVQALAGLGSWEWNIVEDHVTWSEQQYRIHALEPSEAALSYDGYLARVHPEDRERVREAIEHAFRTAGRFETTYRIVRADGTVRWIHGRGQAIPGPAGVTERMMGVCRDVTDRRQTEAALRGSERRFRDLFAQFPVSVQIFAPDGALLAVNPAYERLFGLSLEQLAGFNLLTDPQLEPIRDLVRLGFEGETVFLPPLLYDGSHLSGPGSTTAWPRWIQGFMFPVWNEAGDLREVILVHQDITSTREAEAALRASEESYRTIFELAGDAIFVHDPESGAILDANQRACELTGVPLEELKAGCIPPFMDGEAPYSLADATRYIRRAAASEPQRFEWLGRQLSGEELWVEVSLHGASILGERRVLASVRGIGERKAAEEVLRRANEELERRVAERTAALASANRALQSEIAEHRAAREELLERSAELEGIFEALPDLYFRVDADGTIVDRRQGSDREQYPEPTGFPEDLLGRRVVDYLPPGAREIVADGFARMRETGKLVCVEYRLDVAGDDRDFETRFLPLADGTCIAIVRDITERKRAERELQERKEEAERTAEELRRQALVFNTLNEGVLVTDAEGRIQDWNPGAEQIFGYSREEVLGKSPSVFHDPERAAGLEEEIVAALTRAGRWEGEIPFVRKDGGRGVSEAVVVAQHDDAGRRIAHIGVNRDVTERKAAERALQEREVRFRRLIENASDLITVVDAEGIYQYQSPSIMRVLGYDPQSALGLSSLDFVHPDDVPAARAALARMVAHPGTTHTVLLRFLHGDGTWRVLESTGRTLLNDSAAEGVVVNSRDVTERQRAEEALRQATTAAERANRAKSEFLSRMSHELRTPMNSILGFAQLLGRAADLPPQQTKSVQHILKAGRHLLNLINEVLEIARIEAGRQNLSLEPVRVGPVLQEAVGLVRPLASQYAVELEEGPWQCGGAFVHADRGRLVQVLLNLLGNAIKYNRPGGRVSLTCGPTLEGRVCIRVRDTGRGIPADRVDQLFTPFARLGAEQTEVEGTGLGLALSQRLCDAMGGSLLLEETGPEGSVFRVELASAVDPVAGLEEGGARGEEAGEAPHRDATLLYVEDNLANLSLVETILLARPRWRTVPALQGLLGVELARQHLPDLVLLDLHLPDIPGEEVLRRLRADPRTAGIPVIVISADATRASVERLRAAGADAYLSKPIDVDEFLTTVERFLGVDE